MPLKLFGSLVSPLLCNGIINPVHHCIGKWLSRMRLLNARVTIGAIRCAEALIISLLIPSSALALPFLSLLIPYRTSASVNNLSRIGHGGLLELFLNRSLILRLTLWQWSKFLWDNEGSFLLRHVKCSTHVSDCTKLLEPKPLPLLIFLSRSQNCFGCEVRPCN